MNESANRTREYLTLRILELEKDVRELSFENGALLVIEYARIEENKNALRVLNGGAVPLFDLEVSHER